MDWAISVMIVLGISIIGCAFWLVFRGDRETEPKPEGELITDSEFVRRLEEIMRISDEKTRLLALAELYNTWGQR
jgi:hypothetical protein